jgi:serine/threonine-protein kinase HipA
VARERAVPVWLRGERVGEITARKREEVRFRYDPAILETVGLNTPVLSCSLRTQTRRVDARPFFAGLLPEGDARRKLASDAKLLDTDVLGLLARYGQDVAGAVVVGDEVSTRPRARAELYDSSALHGELQSLADRSVPLAVHDDSELSIAGIQDKMLLVETPQGWARPVNGYPSTHILKLDDRTHRGLVIAEHTCLTLARAAGLPAANSRWQRIGELDAIVVERFDRATDSGGLPARVHQEDACQALGLDLESGTKAKYESDGGPRLAQVAAILRSWGAEDDLYRLLDQVVFTVVIGNADAHGKNISFLHRTTGTVELAPLYDTVPTALWPALRTRAAMSIGAAVDLPDIDVSDIQREAELWHLPKRASHERVLATLEAIRDAAEALDIEDHDRAVATREFALRQAGQLLDSTART